MNAEGRRWRGAAVALLCSAALSALAADAAPAAVCSKPVYLTVDPGNMDFAPRLAEVLRRQQVRATFWASNQDSKNGEGSLGNQWATWWKLMGGQGHEFASQTYDHVFWRADLPGYKTAFRVKPTSGAYAGREFTFDAPKYCEQIEHAARRMEDFTGRKSLPLFHAPGGYTSPKLLAAASACGYAHVGIARGGVLAAGTPLKSAMAEIRSGDVLLVDLKAPPGTEPWAMTNLDPLLVGLKGRGLCFETLRTHPAYTGWISSHGG